MNKRTFELIGDTANAVSTVPAKKMGRRDEGCSIGRNWINGEQVRHPELPTLVVTHYEAAGGQVVALG